MPKTRKQTVVTLLIRCSAGLLPGHLSNRLLIDMSLMPQEGLSKFSISNNVKQVQTCVVFQLSCELPPGLGSLEYSYGLQPRAEDVR